MESIKGVLHNVRKLFWMPRQRYAFLCQQSGFYR